MRNSKLTTLTDALLLAIAFVTFIHSVLEMKNVVYLKTKFNSMIFQNEGLNPIDKVMVSRNRCDTDNGFAPMFNFTFQGIKQGSYNKAADTFSDSSCPYANNCINIKKINSQFMSVWNDKVPCLKRLETKESFLVILRNSSCPVGYKQCGFYNTYQDKLCMLSTSPCLINYLDFKSKLEINFTDPTYDYLPLDGTYFLVTSNNMTNNTVPVDFLVTEGTPCIEVERISFDPYFPVHPRMNNLNRFGCNGTYHNPASITDEGFDRRFSYLHSYSKSKFFADNDLATKYAALKDVKNWTNDITEATFYFVSRGYISMNLTCSNYNDFQAFKNRIDDFKLMKFLQLVFAIVNIFTLMFFISLLSLVKIIKRWLHTTFTFIKIALSALYISYNIIQSDLSIEVTDFLVEYIKSMAGCADKYIHSSIARYEVLNDIKNINYVNMLVYSTSIAYGVLLALQFFRVLYKVYVRIKNVKRRDIARKELGSSFFNFRKQNTANSNTNPILETKYCEDD